MQELIKFILDRLLALWPLRRVDEWQLGLMVRGGIIQRELGPGLHWTVPLWDQVKTYPNTEISVDLEAATVETADGQIYTVSANVSYRMTSIEAYWRAVWNLELNLARVARGRLASFLATAKSAELNGGRGRIEDALRADLAGELEPWGIEVTRFHLTDCVRCRAVRLYHDGQLAGGQA